MTCVCSVKRRIPKSGGGGVVFSGFFFFLFFRVVVVVFVEMDWCKCLLLWSYVMFCLPPQ